MLLHRHIIHARFGPDAGLQWGLSVLVRRLGNNVLVDATGSVSEV